MSFWISYFRLLLTQLGFFGDPENVQLADRLVTAFKDFKIWCTQNKVYSSQSVFTVNSAAWMNIWKKLEATVVDMIIRNLTCDTAPFRYGNLLLGAPIWQQKLSMPGWLSAGWRPASHLLASAGKKRAAWLASGLWTTGWNGLTMTCYCLQLWQWHLANKYVVLIETANWHI